MKVDKARLRAELSRPMSDAEYAQIFRPALARSLLDEIEGKEKALRDLPTDADTIEALRDVGFESLPDALVAARAALSDGDTDA